MSQNLSKQIGASTRGVLLIACGHVAWAHGAAHEMRLPALADAVAFFARAELLDRVSGKPIFPFRLRRAPAASLPGEIAAPYQPDPELPEPFSSPEFRLEDVTDRTPAAREAVLKQVRRSTFGWFAPPVEGRPMLFRSSRGGAEWTGAAIDVPTGRLYVSSNHLVSKIPIYRADGNDLADNEAFAEGRKIFQQACAACHGQKGEGIGMAPPLLGLRHRMSADELGAVLRDGKGAMPPASSSVLDHSHELVDFLLNRKLKPVVRETNAQRAPEFFIGGFDFLTDPDGYPGVKPPWGQLSCINLNTGKILWQVPLGEYDELTRQGMPATGTENFGGATVTAGGLVFCGGTRDRRLRAFDKDTGEELWSGELPWGGYALIGCIGVRIALAFFSYSSSGGRVTCALRE